MESTTMELTAENVNKVFMDCLFREGEPTEPHVKAHAVMLRAGFHPDRLQSHATEIGQMLGQLSDDFKTSKGGGMSFLNACVRADGTQWGEHANIDELLALGLALHRASILMPREMWSALPGGMPYIVVKDN